MSRLFETLPPNFNAPGAKAACSLVSPPRTPPLETGVANSESILDLAVHVLATEAASLSFLTRLYTASPTARTSFVRSVQCIVNSLNNHGKVVFSGMGKSGKIAQKMVATMNSLGLMSFYLHPTEAMHGDMGIIRPQDVLVLVSYSGSTVELVKILSHISPQTAVIAMTAHASAAGCPLTAGNENAILLPTPIHEKEEVTFGVSAPTTSTTVTIALGDALALAVADTMHHVEGRRTQDVFHSFHPGGAIGGSKKALADWAVLEGDMPVLESLEGKKVVDCLMMAFRSKDGWIRLIDGVIPPRRLKAVDIPEVSLTAAGVVVPKEQWIVLDGALKITDARNLVKPGQVISVRLAGGCIGFLESDDIF
ncbi:hypothetical protein H072_8362 [Dactylellina haptotyla CBS 200.50]|uniref:SIS domain-containing protein n=1 Tax=Dactylellina haptotyla (strain CBS 200.50) TaxID=1284197 RepID=S8A4I7_DACHA|nr:hypothetical protein H072_8362 [Dactylellina haptotyla CBS 200.50]